MFALTPVEVERRLDKVLPTLGARLHLSPETARWMREELVQALERPPEDPRNYETVLRGVQATWQDWQRQRDAPHARVYWRAFAQEIEDLASKTEGQPQGRRYLTAAVALAVRRLYLTDQVPSAPQRAALAKALAALADPRLAEKDLALCADELESAGLETTLTLNEDHLRRFVALSSDDH
jgi:hypothetical protein